MPQKKSPVTRTFRTGVSRFIKIKEKVGEGRVVVQKWLAEKVSSNIILETDAKRT